MSARLALVCVCAAVACGAPPKKITLAPAPVPSPVMRAIEAEVAEVNRAAGAGAAWRLVAARELAGVLLEEYQLGGEGGLKLVLSIEEEARVATLQAHFAIVRGTPVQVELEQQISKIGKLLAPLGAVVSGGAAAERAYVAATFSPGIEEAALGKVAAGLLRPRAVVAAAGAFKRGVLLGELRRAAEGTDLRPVKEDSRRAAGGNRIMHTNSALFGWPVDSATPAELVALDAAAHVLADGPESRLARALLEKHAATIEAGTHGKTFEIQVALEPGRTSTAAASAIDRELKALARGETTGLELESARARVRAQLLRELTGIESRAAAAAGAVLSHGSIGALALRMESAEKLDEPTLRAAVAKHLKPSGARGP